MGPMRGICLEDGDNPLETFPGKDAIMREVKFNRLPSHTAASIRFLSPQSMQGSKYPFGSFPTMVRTWVPKN